jgi:hypothetical protein
MRQRILKPALTAVVALTVAASGPLWGGSVSPSNDIQFQALTTDMVAATVSDTDGYDFASKFSYGGTFDQTGWSGTFGGIYQGEPISGPSNASITGDPDWNITGTAKVGAANFPINMTLLQDATDPDKYTLDQTKMGGNTWLGSVKSEINGNLETLKGTLTESVKGVAQDWTVAITLNSNKNTITSDFTPKGKPAKRQRLINQGKYSLKVVGGNFNGTMNVDVATVPEPAALVLVGFSALLGLASYWHQRRRRRRSAEAQVEPALDQAA